MVYVGSAELCITVITIPASPPCIGIPPYPLDMSKYILHGSQLWTVCTACPSLQGEDVQSSTDRRSGSGGGCRDERKSNITLLLSLQHESLSSGQLLLPSPSLFLVKKMPCRWKSDRDTAEKQSANYFFFLWYCLNHVLSILELFSSRPLRGTYKLLYFFSNRNRTKEVMRRWKWRSNGWQSAP